MYQTVGPSSYIIHRLLAQRLHAWAVEVVNTQLLYTHIQRDHDLTTAPLNRIECIYVHVYVRNFNYYLIMIETLISSIIL